ncbi:MAG: hypothetical protein JWQ47_2644 [Glaciihabitans sp.]|jgi:hypothetical protein|nr:hypothetical protein [Glaciihabitans sp.]
MSDSPELNFDGDGVVADRRRDLERLAYGRADSPREERIAIAARQALAKLLDVRPTVDSAEQETPAAPVEGSSDPPLVAQLSFGDDGDAAAVHVQRPRRVLVAVAAVFLLLGLIGGSIATSVEQSSFHPPSAPASASTSEPATFPTPQDSVSVVSVANRWFAGAQAATDKYPFAPPEDASFVSASTRLVVTSSIFGQVWIAKKVGTASGYCLMTESLPLSDGGRGGTMTCASMRDFLLHGISMPVYDGSASVHWAGGEVSITTAG